MLYQEHLNGTNLMYYTSSANDGTFPTLSHSLRSRQHHSEHSILGARDDSGRADGCSFSSSTLVRA